MRTLFISLCICLFCGAFAKASPDGEWQGMYGSITTNTGMDTLPPFTNPPLPRLYSTNPTTQNYVHITFTQVLVDAQVLVYDKNGSLVYQSTVTVVPNSQHSINITSWNRGTYTIRIHVTGGVDDVFTFEY